LGAKLKNKIKETKFMQNRNNKKHFANNLAGKVILSVTVLAVACSSLSSGVTRSTAATAIETDKRYSAAMAVSVDVSGKFDNVGGVTVFQTTADDTSETAIPRAKAFFAEKQPQIAVAEHLGYIKIYFEKPELVEAQMGQQNYKTPLGLWQFKTRAELTDKGKALWQDLKLSVNDQSLPLAARQSPEITGIIDENPNNKRVDFTYKWEPTELGKVFDPSSSAFSKLPPELQAALKKNQFNIFGGRNNVADFTSERKGLARFKKFDDGWRLADLNFL
jgi:hypothetical protein